MQPREACPHYPCLLDLATQWALERCWAWGGGGALQQEGPALHPLPRLPEAALPAAALSAWGHLAEGQKAYCTRGILCPGEGVGRGGRPRSWGGGGTSSELPAQSQPCRDPAWSAGASGTLLIPRSWLKSQLPFSRTTSPLGGRPPPSQLAHRGGALSSVSALLVRTPALRSWGRPPDFTAPSPNTVSWGLQLHRWSWGTGSGVSTCRWRT